MYFNIPNTKIVIYTNDEHTNIIYFTSMQKKQKMYINLYVS